MPLFPALGHGIGLRAQHHREFSAARPACDWLEAISENYMDTAGPALTTLLELRRDYPVGLHGVALGIGNVAALNLTYLRHLRELVARVEPAFVSDHLCWGGYGGHYAHDLLPLPYNAESLAHVVDRVARVQDFLGRRLLLENVSSYVAFATSTMAEAEFLAEVAERADCGILLDVNNVLVSGHNLGFDPMAYLAALPAHRIGQIHLAGHEDMGTHLLDTHGAAVPEAVWSLFQAAVARVGPTTSLVEWDANIPPLPRLLAEAEAARRHEIAALDLRRSA